MKSSVFLLLAIASLLTSAMTSASAEVQTQRIAYEHDGVQLEGLLAWDDALSGKRPGVLVVHEWWGLNDYAEARAKKLAKLGYVAFALDMYGKGQVTKHPSQAGEWAGKVRANTEQWRGRALAGFKILQRQEMVDTTQMAAIGYCFGGSTVLQLAYADAPLKGVVSFHGALVPPTEIEAIDAKVLVCHGAADAFVPPADVQKFEKEMQAISADYALVSYGSARHGFTNPAAGDFGIDNLKYNEHADRRSWNHMKLFFNELFSPAK